MKERHWANKYPSEKSNPNQIGTSCTRIVEQYLFWHAANFTKTLSKPSNRTSSPWRSVAQRSSAILINPDIVPASYTIVSSSLWKIPSGGSETMSLHLDAISRKVAPGAHAILVFDGAGYHGAGAFAMPENITLLRLPRYAPELNPIEKSGNTCAQNNLPELWRKLVTA